MDVATSANSMTVDAYLAWAESRPGRTELWNGKVIEMAPEGAVHARLKARIFRSLEDGLRSAGLSCHAMPDGMTVRIGARTAYEPDALVYCGDEVADDAIEIPHPVLVVEVLSPRTRCVDVSAKMPGYFSLPSVQHYLIADPAGRLLIHHWRGDNDLIVSRIVRDGLIGFDPPGFTMAWSFPPASDG
jgi:Uma2 family endonuclease